MVYYGIFTFFSFFFPPFLSSFFLQLQDINFNHKSDENFYAKKPKKIIPPRTCSVFFFYFFFWLIFLLFPFSVARGGGPNLFH